MRTSDALETAHDIVDMLDAAYNSSWSFYFDGEDHESTWLKLTLAKVVVAIGSAKPIYASGILGDNNGPEGKMVVITDEDIVRVDFTPRESKSFAIEVDSTVSVVNRSRVHETQIDSVSPLDGARDSEWPRRLSVTLMLADGEHIKLPVGAYESAESAGKLAAILPTLSSPA